MNILNALKQLRDDIKAWVTINLNALNAKIDEKTIPIDSELDSTSTNPVQNKAIATEINNINSRVGDTPVATQISRAINAQEHFSGDYNDLTNAPDISEDGSGNMIIADESGNIIFKADTDGIHTTAVVLNGEAAASQKYVDEAIANNVPKVDFTGYATEDFVVAAVESAKEELSESIVAESDEWKVVDEAGNIIFSVDASGAHTTALTLNGESAATESYVDEAIENIEFPTTDLTGYATEEYVTNAVSSIEIPEVDFTGYATEEYVDGKVVDLVNSAPEALNTLGELAIALENHEDAYDALLETVGSKATKTELEDMKAEISESIVSETSEFHIVDEVGNIVASIDENGVATTTVTAHNVVINGSDVETEISGLASNLSTHIENGDIHVTKEDKISWDDKVDKVYGKGLSANDFTDNYKNILDNLGSMAFEETDPTVPEWAKAETKPTYTADEVGLGNVDNTSDINKPVSTATQEALDDLKNELSESIVSESEEWTIVDSQGNIVATINANGMETTAVIAQSIVLGGVDIMEVIEAEVKAYVDEAILGGVW